MALFGKKSDPLAAEIERVEAEHRRLARELAEAQARISNPGLAVAKAPPPEKHTVKGAIIVNADQRENPPVVVPKRLKKQRQMARNRFIVICVILVIIGLVIYRCLQ